MVDNFENLRSLLPYNPEKDTYYIVQIIIRKGTNLNHNNSNRSRTIRNYQITSYDHLMTYKKEILYLCDLTGARAYISLNPRSYKRTAFRAITLLSQSLDYGNENSARSAYDKAMLDVPIVGPKTWMIDFDLKDYPNREVMALAVVATEIIIERLTERTTGRFKKLNPSKTGTHIITSTFRRDVFEEKVKELGFKLELKTDSYTNLYIPNDVALPGDDEISLENL